MNFFPLLLSNFICLHIIINLALEKENNCDYIILAIKLMDLLGSPSCFSSGSKYHLPNRTPGQLLSLTSTFAFVSILIIKHFFKIHTSLNRNLILI